MQKIAEVNYEGHNVTLYRYPLFDHKDAGTECFRVTCEVPGVGEEVAYWHTDGSNDILRGEKGTLIEATKALVDFAFAPVVLGNRP